MKIETILNAMMRVNNNLILVGPHHHKHLANLRQYNTFHDRIIRMDEEKDTEIARLKNSWEGLGAEICVDCFQAYEEYT